MVQRTIALSAALMMIAVTLGAFGAHGLKSVLTPDALDQWHTGVQYHFLHALGLLVLPALGDRISPRVHSAMRLLFLLGILAFSGSLYLLSTRELTGLHALTAVLGPVTPLGGLCFILGWTWLLITALRKNDQR